MGFVYESFRNETNWVIWNFWSYETNPRNESLENRPTKRIHDTNLWKTGLRNESTIRIFKVWIRKSGFASPPAWIRKDSFCAIVLRIREVLWKQVESLENQSTKRIHEMNLLKTLRIHDPRIRIPFIRHKSNLFGVRIRSHDTVRIHGFAKRIHVFMNLLYDSRILIVYSFNSCRKWF